MFYKGKIGHVHLCKNNFCLQIGEYILQSKDVMHGKLFQKCTHFLYFSVLSLGGIVNTRRMSKPEMGSICHIKNRWNILVIGNYYVNHQNFQNLMLLTSSDTKRTDAFILVYKFRPKRTGFNMYAEYNSRPQLTFLALHPWEGTNIKKQYFNYAEGGT